MQARPCEKETTFLDFLPFFAGGAMEEVSKNVRASMTRRKQRLGTADIYARTGGATDPHQMIYEEVNF